MLEKYKTIEKMGYAETVEKKSRFLGVIKPVFSEEEAKAFIDETRKKYWDATHNVFAYQIGEKNEIQKERQRKEHERQRIGIRNT